jgi:hypothetical protein
MTNVPNVDHWISYYSKQSVRNVIDKQPVARASDRAGASIKQRSDITQPKVHETILTVNEVNENNNILVEGGNTDSSKANDDMPDVQLVSPVQSVVEQAKAIKRRRRGVSRKTTRKTRGKRKRRASGKKRKKRGKYKAKKRPKKKGNGKRKKKKKTRDIFNIKIT